MRIEIKKETVYQMTLTKKEISMLCKLLGSLTSRLVTEQLGMTQEQYRMTSYMYNDMSGTIYDKE